MKKWPEPTMQVPTVVELVEMVFGSVCKATDGCIVERDGVCKHGHPSWLLYYGAI